MLSLTAIITAAIIVLAIVAVKTMMVIRVNNDINASIANDSAKNSDCAVEDVSNGAPNAANNGDETADP
ncbi:MAG: hypothetical protein LBH93_01505 [Chitinispirillales bacterium]|jgi:hypothetical protein|nr:hypothetical protein [Chitinispirillales bacterium]